MCTFVSFVLKSMVSSYSCCSKFRLLIVKKGVVRDKTIEVWGFCDLESWRSLIYSCHGIRESNKHITFFSFNVVLNSVYNYFIFLLIIDSVVIDHFHVFLLLIL